MGRISDFLAKITAGTPLPALQLWRGEGQQWDANGVSATTDVMAWAANVTPDGTKSTHTLTATSGVATTIAAPTNMVPGVRHLFIITNGSGGAMGAVAWNAAYLMGAFTPPANGDTAVLEFEILSNGTQLRLVSGSSSGAPFIQGVVTPAWVPAGITINNALGNVFNVVAATAVPFTVGAPSSNLLGQTIRIRILNSSGGVAGGITWNAAYVLMGPAIPPIPDGDQLVMTFTCIAAGTWLETTRALVTSIGPLSVRSVLTIQNAAMLTLPTAGVVFPAFAAPGAGLMWMPTKVRAKSVIVGNVTNIDANATLQVRFAAGNTGFIFRETAGSLTDLLATAGTNIGRMEMFATVEPVADVENRGLQVEADNAAAGDFTGGNAGNSLEIAMTAELEPV